MGNKIIMQAHKKIILAIMIMSSCNLFGQDIFVVGINNKVYQLDSNNNLLYHGDINSNMVTGDIAIAPNGKMYSLKNGSGTNLEILEIDFINNTATIIDTLPIPASGSYSLTCSNSYELFALGSNYELWKYNLLTGTSSFVANLGSSSPGDITFYKGNIIFQSDNGGNIKSYNLANGNINTILCIPNSVSTLLWGLGNVFTACGNEKIIASDNTNKFYELNISNGTVNLINVNTGILPVNVQILGMASTSEHYATLCNSEQLAEVDCSMSTAENSDDKIINIYPNPTDGFLFFNSTKSISSVNIYDSNGRNLKSYKTVSNYIDIGFLSNGVYLFEIDIDNYIYKRTIIKK